MKMKCSDQAADFLQRREWNWWSSHRDAGASAFWLCNPGIHEAPDHKSDWKCPDWDEVALLLPLFSFSISDTAIV